MGGAGHIFCEVSERCAPALFRFIVVNALTETLRASSKSTKDKFKRIFVSLGCPVEAHGRCVPVWFGQIYGAYGVLCESSQVLRASVLAKHRTKSLAPEIFQQLAGFQKVLQHTGVLAQNHAKIDGASDIPAIGSVSERVAKYLGLLPKIVQNRWRQ